MASFGACTFESLSASRPHLLLHIPPRVRGFLELMRSEELAAYRRDRLMRRVLSRRGLLSEPSYIRSRFLFSCLVQFEVFALLRWAARRAWSVRAWMAASLWLLALAQLLHIGLDLGRGDPWRAFLFELLLPLTAVASLQFADTPFTAGVVRTALEDRCAALATVYGRVALNALILFFCLGSLEGVDAFLLLAAALSALCTAVVCVAAVRIRHCANYVRTATESVSRLQQQFVMADADRDGVLDEDELRSFFKSYNQSVPAWQIEVLIAQWDLHRDGGLRFDALLMWFEKVPINHLTRVNALRATPTDLYGEERVGGAMEKEMDLARHGQGRQGLRQVVEEVEPEQWTEREQEEEEEEEEEYEYVDEEEDEFAEERDDGPRADYNPFD